jgi:hypothetical protein
MGSFKYGALIERTTSTATAAGTTLLVYNSTTYQRFTGVTTQIVQLPDATTMVVGQKFVVQNRSTGIVTVNDGSGALLTTLPAGIDKTFQLYANGVVAGTWDTSQAAASGASGGVAGAGLTNINPAVQSPYTLSSTDFNKAMIVNSANGPMQFNLPAPNTAFLVTFVDKSGNFDTNNLTIHRFAAESIGNVAADYVYAAPFGEFSLGCDGTNYFFVAR